MRISLKLKKKNLVNVIDYLKTYLTDYIKLIMKFVKTISFTTRTQVY